MYCCELMKYHCEFKCEIHSDPFDCPDSVVYYSEKNNQFGLIIHDGGSSFIRIAYCPWCGRQIGDTDATID